MYIYLLHFNYPIADHAEHYIGCTSVLRSRLAAHAAGHGSKLTRIAKIRNVTWTLARLWTTDKNSIKGLSTTVPIESDTPIAAFKAEKKLKSQKNAPRYCPICCKAMDIQPRSSLQGLTSYPLRELAMPLISTGFSRLEVATIDQLHIREATIEDRSLIQMAQKSYDVLRKHEAGELTLRIGCGEFLIACVNKQPVGYIHYEGLADKRILDVKQIWVADVFRNRGIGRRLINAIAELNPLSTLKTSAPATTCAAIFFAESGFCKQRQTVTASRVIWHMIKEPLVKGM